VRSRPGRGPCYAEMYGWKTASFLVQGQYWVYAGWSHESYNYYYAWPQDGHQVQMYSTSHRVRTNLSWPSGTWAWASSTMFTGARVQLGHPCYFNPNCNIAVLSSGPNIWSPSEFNLYNDTLWSSAVYCDYGCKIKQSAGLYPAAGASFASGHTANPCRQPTWQGTQNC
jgi:hypothetical protein